MSLRINENNQNSSSLRNERSESRPETWQYWERFRKNPNPGNNDANQKQDHDRDHRGPSESMLRRYWTQHHTPIRHAILHEGKAVSYNTAALFGHANSFDKFTYTIAGLPAGLTIDPATGKISGTPTAGDAAGGIGGN